MEFVSVDTIADATLATRRRLIIRATTPFDTLSTVASKSTRKRAETGTVLPNEITDSGNGSKTYDTTFVSTVRTLSMRSTGLECGTSCASGELRRKGDFTLRQSRASLIAQRQLTEPRSESDIPNHEDQKKLKPRKYTPKFPRKSATFERLLDLGRGYNTSASLLYVH